MLLSLFPKPPRFLFSSKDSRKSRGDSYSDNSHQRKILIVDDESDMTRVFKSALNRIGYEVVTYNNPVEALSDFEPNQYDLAIFDVRMPAMTGFELYSQIRKIDSNLKALFITAYENYEREFLVTLPDLDIKCVLQKPLGVKQLRDAVKETLGDK